MSRSYRHGKYNKHASASYSNWLMNEPKYWRNMCKHRRRRAAVRTLRQSVMLGADTEAMCWPLDRKPWIYYH